jgi:hypothetical protein
MNGFLDDALVGLVLLLSAGYAVSSLGPRSLRKRVLAALARAAAGAPKFLGLQSMERRLADASAGKGKGGCGGCDGCGDEAAPKDAPAEKGSPQQGLPRQGSPQNANAAEIRVPVDRIGRRG